MTAPARSNTVPKRDEGFRIAKPQRNDPAKRRFRIIGKSGEAKIRKLTAGQKADRRSKKAPDKAGENPKIIPYNIEGTTA